MPSETIFKIAVRINIIKTQKGTHLYTEGGTKMHPTYDEQIRVDEALDGHNKKYRQV